MAACKISDCYGRVAGAAALAAEAEALSRAGRLPAICLSSLGEHTACMLADLGLAAGPKHLFWFDTYVSVVQAAKQGLGVAVVYTPEPTWPATCEELVPLSSEATLMPFAMYFVCRPADAERPEIQALRQWAVSNFAQRPWLL